MNDDKTQAGSQPTNKDYVLAKPDSLAFQMYKKQQDRKQRKSHKPDVIVSYPYVTNLMPSPFNPEGWTGATDPDGTILNVTEQNPSGESFVGQCTYLANFFVLNSSSGNRIPTVTDGYAYLSILVRALPTDDDVVLFYRFDSVGSQIKQDFLFTKTGSSSGDVLFTELGDYRLIQIREYITGTLPDVHGRFFIGTGSPVNTVLYAQATFFGTGSDWPAVISPTLGGK